MGTELRVNLESNGYSFSPFFDMDDLKNFALEYYGILKNDEEEFDEFFDTVIKNTKIVYKDLDIFIDEKLDKKKTYISGKVYLSLTFKDGAMLHGNDVFFGEMEYFEDTRIGELMKEKYNDLLYIIVENRKFHIDEFSY